MARILNLYFLPSLSPVTEQLVLVAGTLHDAPGLPFLPASWYPVTGLPPSEEGAVQLSVVLPEE
jgi:hypothetical protein